MSTLLVRGGKVWDHDLASWRDLDISILNGEIVEIAPTLNVGGSDRVLDASGCLVIPGLVNAHTHAHNNLLMGTGDCRWLESHINAMTAVGAWTPRDLYVSTMVGALEMLTTGTTAAYDMVRAPTDEHLAAVVQAYADAGLRATIAPSVADVPFHESVPGLWELLPSDVQQDLVRNPPPTMAPHAAVDFAEEAIRRWHGHADGRIAIAVGPLIADSCSDDLLTALSRLSRDAGVGLHMHLLESKLQAVNGVRRSGGSTWVEHLATLGLPGPQTTMAHGVWLTDTEVAILADAGSSVAHNPASNMKLGSGLAPVRDYRRAGVNVAIATDGAASGDTLDMFSAMWLTGLLNHGRTPDPDEWLTSAELLDMSTRSGAAALGLAERVGSVAVGFRADLTIVSRSSVRMRPSNDALIQLVYGGAGSCVRDVVVDGRLVVEGGSSTLVDSEAILGEADDAARRLGTNAPLGGRAAQLQAPLATLQRSVRGLDFAIDRYVAPA